MRLTSNTEEALRAAAPECMFEEINFVAGRRVAVVQDDFYNKLEKLNVQAGKRDKILLAHVQHICEAHDTVMRSNYYSDSGESDIAKTPLGGHILQNTAEPTGQRGDTRT